jgi:hypothetical protein
MKFIGCLCFLLTSCIIYAQNTSFQPEWAFGANAGANFSKVRFNPHIAQELLLGGTGGITVRYISERNFGLQAELNYAQRGWEEMTDTVFYFNEYARLLHYIELPLMTHIYFDMGKHARGVFNLGPQIGYNIGETTLKKEINTSEIPNRFSQKIQNKFDYGLIFGIGFELRTGIGNFILEGRAFIGLSDIFRNTKQDEFQASPNQVLGAKLTYLIRK